MARRRTPLELDLNSLLQSQSSDEDDDDDGGVARRTVDDILNDSGDSFSSSSSSSPSSPRAELAFRPLFPPKQELKTLGIPAPGDDPPADLEAPTADSPKSDKSEDKTSMISFPRSVFSESRLGFLRRKSGDGELSERIALGRGNSPLPSLFGGIKPNPRPGAALAAAAAASRSVPTPHAAAIKFRRTALQRPIISEDNASSVPGADGEQEEEVEEEEEEEEEEKAQSSGDAEESPPPSDALGAKEVDSALPDNESNEKDVKDNDREKTLEFSLREKEDRGMLNGEVPDASTMTPAEELDQNDRISAENDSHPATGKMEERPFMDTTTKRSESVQMDEIFPEPKIEFASGMTAMNSSNVEEEEMEPTEGISRTEADELADDKSVLSESKKSTKRQGKKSKSSMKPLELAEELEKKNAFSGMHLEEGAAAQPMRLEGIRRGPPAVGYLQINTDNAITHAISSQAFRRDHGSPQSLAVHINYVAVGMSKGIVLVMPSKYSPHSADNLDSKVFTLSSQGEKSHSPVTSMCFSQQGDLLLVGYGNGSLTVWDVQKGSAVKTIAEHTAPVVHALFLGQDSQVTRQYKAVTGDCKGLVLLHTFSVFALLNRFSVKTQCLLDGQRTGTVLCASALLSDEFHCGFLATGHGSAMGSPGGIGSMMGGVVGGVVGGEAGWKLFSDGSFPEEEGVVIFVTHQNALVVRLHPSLEVYAQLSRPNGVREGSMPYTAWKCVMSCPTSSPEELDKASLLAMAWDRKILIAKLVKSELKTLGEWSVDSPAVGVAWLDDRMLVVLTLKGQLCLFTKDGTELHRINYVVDGSSVDDMIAYHTHLTNVFGNPEKACHNSIAVRGATIYILGQMHLVASRLLPWKERIRVLQKAGDWMGALDMAMKLYDGHTHGVIDLPRTTDAIREAIMPFLVELVAGYVDEVFSYISVAFCSQIEKLEVTDSSKTSPIHTEIKEQYARVGGVAVEFCVHISRIDILFDDIFIKFTAVQHGGTFLELLEPYILKDMLGCLPPEIMQALVEHYSRKGWLRRVEQCVLHMDISSLDFNQVVRLCREHGLYSALIYLFNKGLDDFKAPLEELLVVAQDSQRVDAVGIGYRMLVYLKYCFLGLAFPPGQGSLPHSRLPSLRKELIEFLLENSGSQNSQFVRSFKSSIGSCLNLYYLLWLDTEATLEVLRCAFFEDESQRMDSPLPELGDVVIEENKDSEAANKTGNQGLIAQNVANALIRVLDIEVPSVDGSSGADDYECLDLWPSKKELDCLLEFIACFVACQQATIPQNLFKRILEYLTSESDTSSRDAEQGPVTYMQQKQVLALLKAVPQTEWDASYVLQVCEWAQYYQVCSLIHMQNGRHVAALDSYIRDIGAPIHAFAFISNMLLQLKDAEHFSFQSAVIARIPELVKLNREGAFFLIIESFSKENEHMLSTLQPHPECLFLYLKTAIEVHLSGALNFSALTREDVLVSPFYGVKFTDTSEEIQAYLQRLSNFPKMIRKSPIDITDEMAELYLELLCQFEPGSVLRFLETYENHRLEHCLRLCQKYGVTDAAAFLLERAGDVGSSLSLILSGIDSQLENIYSTIRSKIAETTPFSESQQLNDILSTPEVRSLHNILHSSIGLCQRNTSRPDPQESESLWFHLLDSFCEKLRHLFEPGNVLESMRATKNSSGAEGDSDLPNLGMPELERAACISRRMVSQFVREIIEGMVGYVPVPTIMTKLLSDNGSQQFGDFKATILGMLGTYVYERRILDTAKILIEDDTYYIMSLLKKGVSHAYSPQSNICCICSSLLTKEPSASGIHVFHCGHAVHTQCEGGNEQDKNSVECPICMPKKSLSLARSKSILVEDRLVKFSSSRSQHRGSVPVQPLRESDLIERPYGLQQISRFDILNNLQKVQRTLQIDTLPRLRLAPPAIYHERVKMTTDVSMGEENSSVKNEKPSRFLQLKNLKPKGSSFQFPLRSSIFLNEKSRRQ